MTGGSAASSAGVLSRANELNQLSSRINTVTDDITKADKEYAQLVRDKNAAEYEQATAQAELRAAEDSLLRLELDETHRSELIQNQKDSIAAIERELTSTNQRIKRNSDETGLIRTKIIEHEKEAEVLKDQIEDAIRGQDELSQKRESVSMALSELRAQGASLSAEKDALTKAVRQLSVLRDEMTGSRARQLETIAALKNSNEEICLNIKTKEQESAAIQAQIRKQRKTLQDLGSMKMKIEADRSNLNREIQDQHNRVTALVKEYSRLEQKKDSAQNEEKMIVDKLWETYELSRSAAVKAADKIDSMSAAQKRISALKRQISELGNPNIGAIDEFERVNTRYSFLTTQRDDVEKAKSELLGIIGEITTQMCEIFTREFALISECFGDTFKELFGGGRAMLSLEDENDVLGSGIEIHVQPPGKSLRTLTLLSGGEKAFVAIAIYFAILTVRPPPFVVLDEIEAALDDSNVLRFATHLRRMSDRTQMIVITHKRATMEESDVLYGVTMQELGVSNTLRIDLEEAEKHMKASKPAG